MTLRWCLTISGKLCLRQLPSLSQHPKTPIFQDLESAIIELIGIIGKKEGENEPNNNVWKSI